MRALAFWFLAGSFALAPMALARPGGTIVAFGDSITKGQPNPWPEGLEARLRQRFPGAGFTVINAGIPGNRLLHDSDGPDEPNPSALSRFAHDALDPDGVRFVILLEGINDIGWAGAPRAPADIVGADEIIAADRTLIASAHARRVKIFGGTITPFRGEGLPGYYSPAGEAMRAAVNQWIRTGGEFDAVIDFDAALRDPAHPKRLRPEFDSGDHLHPNASGEAAMAAAIDLGLFQ
jgi:lysophospholipase L1-like esterase